ncbi:MAG TPA: UDP-glucose 4-epimerase GalE [Rhizomicrobium sp.]|nr:UDP-glucose 4-epimerase GalE [Rhizomicrobium sp.]
MPYPESNHSQDHLPAVLVTGGAGYIGSHICKVLAASGYRPVVYDNLINGHRWAVRWGAFEHGDILDRARLDEVIAKYRPRNIIHCAAYAYVRESIAHPGKYYLNNVAGTLNLLRAAQQHEIRNVIYSSSCAVFGTPASVPIDEDAPKAPINPYGMTKLTVENMLRDFQQAHGLNWISLRFFNAAGCDPDGEIGEFHDPETHIIPRALAAATGTGESLAIFGTDYDTADGSCIRDYVHVSDLAAAHVLAMKALENSLRSGEFNLGTGKGYSVLEVIETVRQVTGRAIPFTIGRRSAGDPAALVSNPDRARSVLGWTPAIPELRDIVRTAWEWHRSARRQNIADLV